MGSMNPLGALETTGEALYGARWRSPLARHLHRPGAPQPGIDLRLLQRWSAGERPPPDWLPSALVNLLRAEGVLRAADLDRLADRIAAMTCP